MPLETQTEELLSETCEDTTEGEELPNKSTAKPKKTKKLKFADLSDSPTYSEANVALPVRRKSNRAERNSQLFTVSMSQEPPPSPNAPPKDFCVTMVGIPEAENADDNSSRGTTTPPGCVRNNTHHANTNSNSSNRPALAKKSLTSQKQWSVDSSYHNASTKTRKSGGSSFASKRNSMISQADEEAVAQRKFSFVSPMERFPGIVQAEVERKFSRYSTTSISGSEEYIPQKIEFEKPFSFKEYIKEYFEKIFRRPTLLPPTSRPPWYEVILSSAFSAMVAFVTICSLWLINDKILEPLNIENNTKFKITSYSLGSVAVVLFEAYQGPFAQPWNTLVGSVVSCFLGLTLRFFLFDYPFIAAPSAVALSIIAMRVTHSTHPPAGAIAVSAALAPNIGNGASAFLYLLMPTFVGSAWIVIFAVLLNNLDPKRQFPQYWL